LLATVTAERFGFIDGKGSEGHFSRLLGLFTSGKDRPLEEAAQAWIK
jgi:hypothetical protein